MITIAQIGCGYWGPNLLRNFASNPKCRVKWVVDPRPERRKFVQAHYKHVDVAPEFHVALADPDVDALVISTPSASHVQLALQALAAGKHILVEKPLATTAQSFSGNATPLMMGAIAYVILFIPVVVLGRFLETRFRWRRI